jgi:SOS-response transcriptional repressor LexA
MANTKVSEILSVLMGNMSEAALASAINVPKATIHRVLSGSTPDPRAGTLLPIAQYFNISIEQLMGVAELPNDFPLQTKKAFDSIQVPFIPIEEITPWMNNEYTPTKFYEVTSFSHKSIDQSCFVTQITTDEMAPMFPNKTYLISKKMMSVDNDNIVIAVDLKERLVLIRKYVELKGERYLIPANPAYDIISFDQKIRLIGVVIEGRIII